MDAAHGTSHAAGTPSLRLASRPHGAVPPPAKGLAAAIATAVAAGCLALAATAWALAAAPPPPVAWASAACFAFAMAALHLRTFVLPWRGQGLALALDEAVVLLALATLPPALLPILVSAASLSAQLLLRREPRKALWNWGSHTASAGLAASACALLATSVPALPAAAAGTALFAVATTVPLAHLVARVEGSKAATVLRERLGPVIFLQAAAGIGAGVGLLALWRLHPAAVLAVVPFLLLARGYMGVRASADHRADAHARIAELSRRLAAEADEGVVAERVLELCGEIFPATVASLRLEADPPRTWSRAFPREAARLRALEAPMTARDGAPLGRLVLGNSGRGAKSGLDREILGLVAEEAAVTIERARLLAAERAARLGAETALGTSAEALRARAESEARLRAFIENAPAAIHLKDPEGRYVLVNRQAEEAYGAAPGAMRGRTDAELLPADLARQARETDELVLATRRPHESETLAPATGRVYRTIRFVVEDEGRAVALCGIATDITDRKAAEEDLHAMRGRLAESEKLSAIGSLVSGMAHEIRTPLTYMGNNLQLARRRLERARDAHPEAEAPLGEIERHVRAAQEASERVEGLVRDLRRFARPPFKGREPTRLDEIVGEAVTLFRASAGSRVRLTTDLRPTGSLLLDRIPVQQVTLHLLANASESMPQGGRVHVATRPAEGGAELVVEDEGPGIDPSIETRLYEPLHTTKATSAGLGLAIARRIVEAHGGRIGYESRRDEGTRFRVFLPAPAAGWLDAPAR